MPALYRMPVFYLVLGVGLVAFGLGYRPPPPPPVEVPEAAPVIPKVAEGTVEIEGGSASDGILRTPEGLRRKVLVKDLAVACRTDPGGGKVAGPPLDYFAIRYLFDAVPPDRPVQFRVGPRGGPPQGWISAASVLEWDTRLMARPTPRSGRPPLAIYREERCLVARLEGKLCPAHGRDCPTEGEEPAGPDASAGVPVADGPPPPLGFPILRSKAVDGRTLFEVASLVRDRAPGPILPPEPPPDLRGYLKVVDVAFVIDTTASMQGTIDAARKLATDLVDATARRYGDVTLRFALVEYRDAATYYGFRARKVTDFTDAEGFLAALHRIVAATRGDGTRRRAGPRRRGPGPPPPQGRADRRARPTGRRVAPATSPPSSSSCWATPPTTTATSTGPGALAGAGQGRRDHDRHGRRRPPRVALARRAVALRRPVAGPGRGVLPPARQGVGLRPAARAAHPGAQGRRGPGRPAPGAHRRPDRARPDDRRAGHGRGRGEAGRVRRQPRAHPRPGGAGARRPPPGRCRAGGPARPPFRGQEGPLGPPRLGRARARRPRDGDGRDADVPRPNLRA